LARERDHGTTLEELEDLREAARAYLAQTTERIMVGDNIARSPARRETAEDRLRSLLSDDWCCTGDPPDPL
jgi:hypothetical protein